MQSPERGSHAKVEGISNANPEGVNLAKVRK
jgi:hypothetical protein